MIETSRGRSLCVQCSGNVTRTMPLSRQKFMASIVQWLSWLSSNNRIMSSLLHLIYFFKCSSTFINNASVIHPLVGLLAKLIQPFETSVSICFWNLALGKIKTGYIEFPAALTIPHIVMSCPLLAETLCPTGFCTY